MQYKAEFLLDETISEGIQYAIAGHKMKEEDRLYQLWIDLYTNPYAKVPGYQEFKKESTGKKEDKKVPKLRDKKLGTLKGQDLTRG